MQCICSTALQYKSLNALASSSALFVPKLYSTLPCSWNYPCLETRRFNVPSLLGSPSILVICTGITGYSMFQGRISFSAKFSVCTVDNKFKSFQSFQLSPFYPVVKLSNFLLWRERRAFLNNALCSSAKSKDLEQLAQPGFWNLSMFLQSILKTLHLLKAQKLLLNSPVNSSQRTFFESVVIFRTDPNTQISCSRSKRFDKYSNGNNDKKKQPVCD